MLILLIEGIVMCFAMLIVCVIGVANDPVNLVMLYENDVKERVVELGYTTKEKIKRNSIIAALALLIPFLTLPPIMVYGINKVTDFITGFSQMTTILWIAGIFDVFFIDQYWVKKTKAWIIPGTEDLMPYISEKVSLRKLLGKIFGYPMIAGIIAEIVQFIFFS